MARIVKQSRGELRKERYAHLITLGFSASDARLYRDRSSTRILAHVEDTYETVVAKKSNVRTDREKTIVKAIRTQRKQRKIEPVISPRLKPISERAEDFSKWTRDGFPMEAIQFIEDQNEKAGKNPANSYGYRRFYWAYVENVPIDEMGDMADRGDSGELS